MFVPRFLKRFKDLRVRRSEGEIEFQDVFLDKLVQEREYEEGEFAEKKLEIPVSRWIFWGLYGSFIVIVIIFFGKTFQLQALAGEELSKKAAQNTIRSYPVVSERGVVYDALMTQLVFNRPSFDFVCDKRDLPEDRREKERILRESADILGISFKDLRADFDRTPKPRFLVGENLSHEELILFETKKEDLEGCVVEKNTIREYVQNPTLSHILGYTAKISADELEQFPEYFVTDQIGKTGIEKSYETELRGIQGQILVEKDALGRVVKDKGEIPSEPGNSILLWLDFELQKKIEEALQKTLVKVGSKKGVGIAIDPNTGGILALVSIPGYDNNLFSGGIKREDYQNIIENPLKPLFNRAIAGNYPTGSTIKPLVATAALAEDIINPDKEILTEGFIEIPNEYDPEIVYRFNDWKNHGWVDMRDAIAVSSNVYFYTIGGGYEDQEGLGPSRIKKYLSAFGWGAYTGIDLPGETKGLIPDPAWKKDVKNEGWWDGDTYLLSIGQGDLLVTPLQVAASFVQFANGGTLYVPKMVKGIIEIPDAFSEGRFTFNNDGGNIKEIPPEIIRNDIIDAEDLQIVREGMRQAVKWGSSVLLNQLPVSSAAKTGTAQTGRKNAEGNDLLYSWVNTFAPYEDPEIVLTIMVEDAEEGSLVVLPVAKEILEWYFTR